MVQCLPATLKAIMKILRAPGGCPWDREQTHGSLAPCLMEESAEVLDAIAGLAPGDEASEAHLCEELGDLMLQVAFHARLADERGAFDMHDVEEGIVEKLVRRHPHVFGGASAETSQDVLANWQAIKKEERAIAGLQQDPSLLNDAKAGPSSLAEAMEIGRRCANVGFDWPDCEGVLDKVREEIAELTAESEQGRVEEEFGDVLFSLVQWARHKKIDPDLALRRQMVRFRRRFCQVEALALDAGGWGNVSVEQMEAAWREGKAVDSGSG
jgi:MazG family protein